MTASQPASALLDLGAVADVALDLGAARRRASFEHVLAVHVEVEHGHPVAGREELGHEDRADSSPRRR